MNVRTRLMAFALTTLALVPTRLLTQGGALCASGQNVKVKGVSIMATDDQSGRVVPADTLWIPSEGRYRDSIYVRILIESPSIQPGDSVYGIASIGLMLRTRGTEQGGPPEVRFPSKLVADKAAPLGRQTEMLLGPFSTNHLIPWNGIVVEATANAMPVGIQAEGSVLKTHRSASCVENLSDNQGRSAIVKVIYAK
jgi:hypothetical protein